MNETNAISAVSEEIMTPYVIKLKTDATLNDVIKTQHQYNITAVFIHNPSNSDYFIISQTDIINFLYKGGLERDNLPNVSVKEIMRGPIKMMDFETPVDKLIRFMAKFNYKRVLISKNGKAVGVISTKDIMKWNNTYFKPAKPQVLIMLDNLTSNAIARHIFEENLEDEIEYNLIDMIGAALKSISIIMNEVIQKSGNLYHLLKDNRSILFEPHHNIMGILICDYNSIELRFKLQKATRKFYKLNVSLLKNAELERRGVLHKLDIAPILEIFNE